jgi:hypothetical protein
MWDDGDFRDYALWIGANPSTASVNIDDPTIRKEMHFTRQMGFSSFVKCNVMDYRATNPKVLLGAGIRPVSNQNFDTIIRLARQAKVIIAAWGALAKPLRNFATAVDMMLGDYDIWCMGMTKDGAPRHPLYLKNAALPIPYRAAHKMDGLEKSLK